MIHHPKSNLFLRSRIFLVFILLFAFSFSPAISFAQREGYLQCIGSVRKDSKDVEGAEVKVMKNGVAIQTIYTKSNGKFVSNLPLNGEYIVVFGKPGLLSKSISIST